MPQRVKAPSPHSTAARAAVVPRLRRGLTRSARLLAWPGLPARPTDRPREGHCIVRAFPLRIGTVRAFRIGTVRAFPCELLFGRALRAAVQADLRGVHTQTTIIPRNRVTIIRTVGNLKG